MALILQIDTAGTTATVSVAKNGVVTSFRINENRNDHASFLQPAIQSILQEQNILLSNLDAIAVSNGPGSYTGLRVGLSSAKGLCYALQKPLIAIGTLQIIALASSKKNNEPEAIYIPMIDARRMEVFTGIYNANAEEIVAPHSLILSTDSFENELLNKKIIFAGDGVEKFSRIFSHKNAVFLKNYNSVQSFSILSLENFNRKTFADLAYTEPLYVKEFNDGKK